MRFEGRMSDKTKKKKKKEEGSDSDDDGKEPKEAWPAEWKTDKNIPK